MNEPVPGMIPGQMPTDPAMNDDGSQSDDDDDTQDEEEEPSVEDLEETEL
jgi:hypothetical protein